MPDPTQIQKPIAPPQTNTTPQASASEGQKTENIDEPTVSSGNKEQEPIIAPVSEVAKSADAAPEIAPTLTPEVKIPQELKNIVEHGPDGHELKLEKEVQQVRPAAPAVEPTPVITTPAGKISIPLTYSQAQQKKNNTPISNSLHWLAAMIMYQWCKYDPDAVKEVKQKSLASN